MNDKIEVYGLKFKLVFLITFSFLIFSNSLSAMYFDPDAALKEQQEEKEKRIKEKKIKDSLALYELTTSSHVPDINEDGTVSIGDVQWMRCTIGQKFVNNSCAGQVRKFSWKDAQALPSLMNKSGGFAGYSDWRMPTARELATIRTCNSKMAYERIRVPGSNRYTFSRCINQDSKISVLDSEIFPWVPNADPIQGLWSGSEFYKRDWNKIQGWYLSLKGMLYRINTENSTAIVLLVRDIKKESEN